MGVNEIDFRGLSAAQGLNSGLRLGATLGGMYRDNRLQDQELEREEAQRMINDMARDAYVARGIEDPAQRQAYLQRRVEQIKKRGGDPSDTMGLMQLPFEQQTQELDYVIQKALPVSSYVQGKLGQRKFIGSPQRVKDENGSYLVGLVQDASGAITEERVPIGGEFISTDGLTAEERIEQKRLESGAAEQGKLEQRIELEPELAKRIAAVKRGVESAGRVKDEQRSNARALETYETGISNLAEALDDTMTGPIMGRLPAMTASAQGAEGAIAVMAPIMKSIFRTAGEGTFTDSDQRMLMGMLPTRQDLPEAKAAKLQAIDMIVRSKLGAQTEQESESGAYSVGQVIEIGGKKYRVTGGDMNDPDVELVE